MRSLLFSLLFVSPFFSYAQQDAGITLQKDEQSGFYSYQEIVDVENVSKEQLFNRAKTWIIANLKTTDENQSFDNKTYTIINNGNLLLDNKAGFAHMRSNGVINFKMRMSFKDNRYRMVIDNIVLAYDDVSRRISEPYENIRDNKSGRELKTEANSKIRIMAAALEKSMKTESSADTQKDDW